MKKNHIGLAIISLIILVAVFDKSRSKQAQGSNKE